MRRLLDLAALSALCAALFVAAVPIAPCEQPAACPMLAALAAAGHGGHCDPEPRLDCCAHDRTAPGRDAGPVEAGQLAAAAVLPAPVPAAAPVPPARRLRATTAPVQGDDPVPLYTLLATLLI